MPPLVKNWFDGLDPLVQLLVVGGAAVIVLVLILRVLGGLRERRDAARRRAVLHREREGARAEHDELQRLADKIVTTSSTTRLIGFAIVRQVEAVFTEGFPSSVAALENAKALAARKGANALINLDARQTPAGKWVAAGDAVIVRPITPPASARTSPLSPTPPPPPDSGKR